VRNSLKKRSRLSKEARRHLKELLGDRFLTKEEDLYPYAFDASPLSFSPEAVALPHHKEEVLEILKLSYLYEFPVVSRGSGSATTGSALPIEGGLVLSLARLNRILELNQEERIVRVEPGVLNGDLKRYLRRYGLFYPPDPASFSFSTIGGNVATNAGGPRGLKYGTTKDYVLALVVGLMGGKLLKTGAYTLKGVVPYNLTSLFVGSEGTLGVFLEIVLKVLPLPPQRVLFLAFWEREEAALEAISEALKRGLTPATAEFVDQTTLLALREEVSSLMGEFERLKALLFVEFDGKEEEVRVEAELFERLLREFEAPFLKAEKEDEIESLWEIRRSISPALKRLRGKKVADDVTLPRRNLATFLRFLRTLEEEEGVMIAAFGHAGDGNLHVNLLFEEGDEERAQRVRETALRKVLELWGTLSGEHGVGYTKRPYVLWELDPLQLEMMKGIKRLFDPKGLLNPQIKLPP